LLHQFPCIDESPATLQKDREGEKDKWFQHTTLRYASTSQWNKTMCVIVLNGREQPYRVMEYCGWTMECWRPRRDLPSARG
ncbi:hypothetical protein J6590_104928, partial [Homalodisca vitripennis]